MTEMVAVARGGGGDDDGGGGCSGSGVFRLNRLMSSYTDTTNTDAGAIAKMRGPRPLMSPFSPLSAIKIRYSDLSSTYGERKRELEGGGGGGGEGRGKTRIHVQETDRHACRQTERKYESFFSVGYYRIGRGQKRRKRKNPRAPEISLCEKQLYRAVFSPYTRRRRKRINRIRRTHVTKTKNTKHANKHANKKQKDNKTTKDKQKYNNNYQKPKTHARLLSSPRRPSTWSLVLNTSSGLVRSTVVMPVQNPAAAWPPTCRCCAVRVGSGAGRFPRARTIARL